MATFDWAGLAADAAAIVEEFGRPATLVRMSEDPVDSAAPWEGPGTPGTAEELEATFVFFGGGERDAGTTGVRKGSGATAIVNADADPTGFHYLVDDDGRQYRIEAVDPVRPGPTAVLYGLMLGG